MVTLFSQASYLSLGDRFRSPSWMPLYGRAGVFALVGGSCVSSASLAPTDLIRQRT
jgi:hypothetical protein